MKYKVGDRVRIKSLDWYNENKDEYGNVDISYDFTFYADRSKYCGKVFTISEVFDNSYFVKEDNNEYYWADEMIEGLVEEETKPNVIEEAKTYWDSIKDAWICPDGYQFKDENGNVINATKIVLEKKKKEYPKTYKECCDVLRIPPLKNDAEGYKWELLVRLQELLICRDAYWKIAGEEMGLGKPWEPDWKNPDIDLYVIINIYNRVEKAKYGYGFQHCTFSFPTPEMRDAFYESFKNEIEICKELL